MGAGGGDGGESEQEGRFAGRASRDGIRKKRNPKNWGDV